MVTGKALTTCIIYRQYHYHTNCIYPIGKPHTFHRERLESIRATCTPPNKLSMNGDRLSRYHDLPPAKLSFSSWLLAVRSVDRSIAKRKHTFIFSPITSKYLIQSLPCFCLTHSCTRKHCSRTIVVLGNARK